MLAVLLPAAVATAASIDFEGGFVASDLGGPLLFTVPPSTPVVPYNSADDGEGTAIAISGFSSLAGVAPADLTIALSDLELVSISFAPGGCTPTPPPGFSNCDTVTLSNADTDGTVPFFDVVLAGVGTILTGEVVFLDNVIATNESDPGFGIGTATGEVLFTGGVTPYFAEALLLTGGTGVATLTLDTFDAVCAAGSDPCDFDIAGTLEFVPEPSSFALLASGLLLLGSQRGRTHRGRC